MSVITKESTVILLDCGPSMKDDVSVVHTETLQNDTMSKFQLAKKIIVMYLTQRILFHPKDNVALILFGTTKTDNEMYKVDNNLYSFINVICPLAPPTLGIIEELIQTECSNNETDCLDGIIVASDLLEKYTSGKKILKQIVIFTDGGATKFSAARNTLHEIAHCLKTSTHKIQLHWLEGHCKTHTQESTYCLLNELCHLHGGLFTFALQTLKDYSAFKIKKVKQTIKTRLNLVVSQEFQIQVYSYLKIKPETLPSLQSESTFESAFVIAGGSVHLERLYTRTITDPSDHLSHVEEEVPKNQRARAFLYGQDLIPVMEQELVCFKLKNNQKSLKVIGSVDKDIIPVYLLTDKTECIAADYTSPIAITALADIIEALSQTNSCLIARYVWREAYPPKLVLLTPNVDNGCLYLNGLPFSEDYTELQLGKLPHISELQSQILDTLISSLTLIDDSIPNSSVKELFSPIETINPTLQHCILNKLAQHHLDYLNDYIPKENRSCVTYQRLVNKIETEGVINLLKKEFGFQHVRQDETVLTKRSWGQAFIKQDKKIYEPLLLQNVLSSTSNDIIQIQPTVNAIMHDPWVPYMTVLLNHFKQKIHSQKKKIKTIDNSISSESNMINIVNSLLLQLSRATQATMEQLLEHFQLLRLACVTEGYTDEWRQLITAIEHSPLHRLQHQSHLATLFGDWCNQTDDMYSGNKSH